MWVGIRKFMNEKVICNFIFMSVEWQGNDREEKFITCIQIVKLELL